MKCNFVLKTPPQNDGVTSPLGSVFKCAIQPIAVLAISSCKADGFSSPVDWAVMKTDDRWGQGGSSLGLELQAVFETAQSYCVHRLKFFRISHDVFQKPNRWFRQEESFAQKEDGKGIFRSAFCS